MWNVEAVKTCGECRTVTPHSRRRVSVPVVAALAVLGITVWVAVSTGSPLVPLVGVFLGFGVLAADRERCWHIACERCRGKARVALRRTKPGPHTEIFLA
jgi:hypothetical protein